MKLILNKRLSQLNGADKMSVIINIIFLIKKLYNFVIKIINDYYLKSNNNQILFILCKICLFINFNRIHINCHIT